MRKILLSILLATTVATPALAQRTDREDRTEAREERKSEREKVRKERTESRDADRTPRADAQRAAPTARTRQQAVTPRANVGPSAVQQRQAQRADAREQRQEARQDRADSRNQWQQQANQARQRVRVPTGARPDRPAPPPQVANNTRAPTWGTSWRRDSRYDWRRYRDRNRSIFNLGAYYDPFGWGYQRWGVGWRLWPSYYSSNYWLNDPWMYRLPYAPWPYKWVRYWDDAILVNTMTGQVVDVEYNFFW